MTQVNDVTPVTDYDGLVFVVTPVAIDYFYFDKPVKVFTSLELANLWIENDTSHHEYEVVELPLIKELD